MNSLINTIFIVLLSVSLLGLSFHIGCQIMGCEQTNLFLVLNNHFNYLTAIVFASVLSVFLLIFFVGGLRTEIADSDIATRLKRRLFDYAIFRFLLPHICLFSSGILNPKKPSFN